MDKIKEYTMITVAALAFIMITGVAKSDENTTTPQGFVTAIAEVPAKVGNHIQTEWAETKAYQAKSWAEAKAQWQSLLNKFVKTESNQ